MYLKDYMSEERVFSSVECMTKADLINKMVGMIKESMPSLNRELAASSLLEKEGVFSTGVGSGIAIPHAVVQGMDKTYLSVAQLKSGIDYRSVDSEPVRLVFMLLSPEGKTQEHIKLLARIARICFKQEFVDKMKSAGNGKELYKLIIEEDVKHEE